MSFYFKTVLRYITAALEVPVVVVLILLIAAVLVLLGSLIAEFFTEHRYLKENLPTLVDDLKRGEKPTAEIIEESKILKRQKDILIELTRHPDITDDMREALARRLLEEEQGHYAKIVRISDLISKLGPMFGLLGTLIPLGPGIIALGEGDTYTLSQSLLTAFDTTAAGLVVAAVALIVSTIRKGWYANYMSILETLVVCVLEVEKSDEK